jgi:outer membrane protein assembly factor BamE (lipoprotein component of BamABCDE complex)
MLSRHVASLFLAAVTLSGCVGTGSPAVLGEEVTSLIMVGVSTKEEVYDLLGEPTASTHSFHQREEGTRLLEVWNYNYAKVGITPDSYLPLFGPFLGSSSVLTGSVIVRFDMDGVVQHVARGPYNLPE